MKKIDIILKVENLNQWEAEIFYNRLVKGLNPIHPTATKAIKEKIIEQLGYEPEFK